MVKKLLYLAAYMVVMSKFAWANNAVIVQPADLTITKIGVLNDGPPAQMVFGPDGRLYISLANFGDQNVPSVVSYAYNPVGSLTAPTIAASTGGALRVGFGPVTLGNYGSVGAITTTGMYLTDISRNDISNLRVLTPGSNGIYGEADGTNTIIVQNIP